MWPWQVQSLQYIYTNTNNSCFSVTHVSLGNSQVSKQHCNWLLPTEERCRLTWFWTDITSPVLGSGCPQHPVSQSGTRTPVTHSILYLHTCHTHTASCISLVIIHLLQHGRFIHLSHTQGILDHLLHTAGYIYIAVTHTEHPVSQPGIHTPVTHSMIYLHTCLTHTHTILYHCLVFIHLLYTQYASSQTGKHSIS